MSVGLATSEKRLVEFCHPIYCGVKALTSSPSLVTELGLASGLKHAGFFSGLSQPSIRAISQVSHVKKHPKGAIVYFEGDRARGVYLMLEGRANILTGTGEGRTLVLRVALPGHVLGLNSVFAGASHAVTVETLQPCRFAFIARENFLKLIMEHNDASLHFARLLGQDCHSAYDLIRSMAKPVPTRLARFLVSCCGNECASEGAVRVRLSLTREAIGQRIGCTRETVSRVLSNFKRRGLAELVGTTLLVHNRRTLENLSVS